MFNFDRSSISQKLTLISMLSTGSALLLVLIAFTLTSVVSHKESESRQLRSLAGVIGANSAGALRLADGRQAQQILAALAIKEEITQAALFDSAGKPLARYVAAPASDESDTPDQIAPEPLPWPGAVDDTVLSGSGPFWAPLLRLYQPVRQRDQIVGAVMLEAGLGRMWLAILRQFGVLAGAALLSFGLALLLAARFKHVIAEPIAKLIGAAHMVSTSQTYSHRIVHQRNDELGALIDSFNDMLAQIDSRDATLAHYRGQLERQVSVRTEQLEKAKNAAEAASQAKSAFLATMSHEIRTPMNGVLGMTELLLASQLTEQQRHYTSMVKRSGDNLLVIINDILDFSKIEAGKLTVEYIRFNFRELLDDIDHVFSPQADSKSLLLEFDIANDIPVAICGDPNRLRQIIVNLLGNAIKFTDSGAITVKVKVAGEDAQTVGLRFEVHDTGIGVSNDAQGRIFESFSQADGSTTRKHGGTGLGLSISKQLVELMGGKIGIDNALTQGSIFWFTVNFDKPQVDADEATLHLSTNSSTSSGIRALIVDHTPATRAVLEGQLASWHIASDSALSATDALQQLHAAAAAGQPYQVALLDMELPRTSGLALAATIKADALIGDIRLLLLSTERGAADSVQRREAGVAFQLIKPARECDLYDCIVTPPRAGEGLRGNPGALNLPPHLSPHLPPHPAHLARAQPGRKRRKILLAEDNPVNIEVALAMLGSLGLDVVCARNGQQALVAAQHAEFDLVLMDCQMPVMDGFAATAEIRRHQQQQGQRRPLPIVAITANALQGDREACLAAGMDDYLSKPFTQQQLGQTIGRWISLPRAAQPRPQPAPVSIPVPLPIPVAAPATAKPGNPHDAAALNRRALDNIRALGSHGEQLLERVIHAFVDDTPRQLGALRAAIDSVDPGGIRKTAHSLKSSSANIGADSLAQMCKDMESLGRGDSTDGAAHILSGMEQEFLAVRHSLSAILEREI